MREHAGAGRRRVTELLVALFSIVLAGVTILDEVGPHDEGLVLAAAGRVADGQLPYQDFWWNYGPGEAVALAGLVALFGPSLLAWRIVRVLAGAAVAVLCVRLARRHGADERWAAAAGVGAGSAVAWPLTPGPTVFALVPALGALLVAARPGVRAPLLAGALAAAAAWLRPELGLAAGLGALVLLPGHRGALVAASVGAGALLYAPFVLADPAAFADDAVGFLGLQDLQRLPFPLDPPNDPNKAFEVLFPALLLAATAAWVLLGRARPVALIGFVAVGVAYLLARTDEFHLVPLAAVLAPALAVGAARSAGARRWLLGLALAAVALHGVERQAGRLLNPPALERVPGGVGDGVRTTAADAAALRVLVPRVRALGRPVLVLPPRMDRVRFGNPLLNVILDLPNPTRHDVIQPGVVTRDAAQARMVADLIRTRATVIRWRAPAAAVAEPNGAGRERGSRRLDAFVDRNYRRTFAAGDYVVFEPR